MKIPVYYCNISNFGDKLNEDLLSLILSCDVKTKSLKKAEIMGIGSLLDNILLDKNDKKIVQKPIKIFSSGFGFEEGGFFHNKDIILPEKLKRNVKCYALRGNLTKERIEKLTGRKQSCAIGDGGLLSNLLIKSSNVKKIYDLGVVPHYADVKNPIWNKLLSVNSNSILLDTTLPPKEFLRHLCSCKTIVSTAMHPLIASDALGIPNLWIRISEETTSRYKFEDYYSAYNLEKFPQAYMLSDDNYTAINAKFVLDNYKIPQEQVAEIQNALKIALENLSRDIQREHPLIFLQNILKNYILDRN